MNITEAYAAIVPLWNKGSISIGCDTWCRQHDEKVTEYAVDFTAHIFTDRDITHSLRAKTLAALVDMMRAAIIPATGDTTPADEALSTLPTVA